MWKPPHSDPKCNCNRCMAYLMKKAKEAVDIASAERWGMDQDEIEERAVALIDEWKHASKGR